MKYILIAFIIKDLVISSPWAAGISAEFDDKAACEQAVERIQKQIARLNAGASSFVGCVPKSSGN